jgi:hypothetical protein
MEVIARYTVGGEDTAGIGMFSKAEYAGKMSR